MLQELYGAFVAYTSAAGASNDVAPAGFGPTVDRLDVTLSANSSWSGLTAGRDGQWLLVTVVAGAFTLTLQANNVGSLAANRFRAAGDTALVLNDTFLLRYYAGSVNMWVVVP
jgi:hypothetical protein